jgi:hypothetical protein
MTGHRPPSDETGTILGYSVSPRTLVALLIIALTVAIVVAIRFTDIPGSSNDDNDEDVPEVLARSGCLDMDIIPLSDPPISLLEAEADVRSQLDEVGSITGSGPDDEFEPGDLIWAEYGELAPGTSGRVHSGEAWVLIFEDTRHESWWDRLANRRIDARFSVVYRPESGQITQACGGRV